MNSILTHLPFSELMTAESLTVQAWISLVLVWAVVFVGIIFGCACGFERWRHWRARAEEQRHKSERERLMTERSQWLNNLLGIRNNEQKEGKEKDAGR